MAQTAGWCCEVDAIYEFIQRDDGLMRHAEHETPMDASSPPAFTYSTRASGHARPLPRLRGFGQWPLSLPGMKQLTAYIFQL